LPGMGLTTPFLVIALRNVNNHPGSPHSDSDQSDKNNPVLYL